MIIKTIFLRIVVTYGDLLLYDILIVSVFKVRRGGFSSQLFPCFLSCLWISFKVKVRSYGS